MVPATPPPKVTLSFVAALSYFTAALSVAVCASLTSFNWSSVAACPLVMLAAFHVLLLKPPIFPVLPSTVICVAPLPTLTVLPKPSCTPSVVVVLVMLPSVEALTLRVSPNLYWLELVPLPNLMPVLVTAVFASMTALFKSPALTPLLALAILV